MSTTMASTSAPPSPPQSQPVWRTWRSWDSVAVVLVGIPRDANTYLLWKAFQNEGNIMSIDIFDDRHGKRSSKGKIRFRPPPPTAFWESGVYAVQLSKDKVASIRVFLDFSSQDCFAPSPARSGISYPAELRLQVSRFDVGVRLGESAIHTLKTLNDSPSFVVNVKERAVYLYFQEDIRLSTNAEVKDPLSSFRLKLPFYQLTRVWEMHDEASQELSFLIILDSPVVCHRKMQNIKGTFQGESSWRESDTWHRQTAIVHNPWLQLALTTNLRRSGQIVDIGRWNVFKITVPAGANSQSSFELIHEILRDHNIIVEHGTHFKEAQEKIQPVWQWIDGEIKPGFKMLGDLADQHYVHMPFPVRYQLEVCISHGRLSEFTMTRDFVVRLMDLGETKAKRLLEHVATHKPNYLDPMEIFNIKIPKGVTDSSIPAYCCFMRTARITPTTVYYNTPSVDTSNRVTRRYIEFIDRFIRVRFTDEVTFGRINSSVNGVNNEIFGRVKKTMANGITIGDRHYEFLAFGNSQFREHGAYFFAPLPNLSAAHIRAWMGQFSHIRNIAKYAARLGQCFSTTRAIGGCPVQVRKCKDITRKGYCFSDGVGKISNFLAAMAMNELKIRTPKGQVPSAFQFRLGGCKGMLTVSADPLPNEVHIRPSQFKFESAHGGLEIIRWSQYSMATLNRQLILVLSALGIEDEVFLLKLKTMVASFSMSMNNDTQASYLLQKFVDPNQTTLSLAQMVHDGFRRTNEPFITSMLALWKAWHLKSLKGKAKIVIDQGANLLGVLDETGTLKGHFNPKKRRDISDEEMETALPEIFVQISHLEKGGSPEVVEGRCILARNPSLHPGDIRIVRAVNRPELRHLVDVIVFPQTGDRDLASMCAGGDLDGDDYLVIWDEDLVPKFEKWFTKPMKYTSRKAPDLPRDVTVDDITSFFVTYMKNDCLPRIAHAHMAWADRLDNGVREDKCIRLAQLHSDAVDYNKTGGVAKMTRDLEPKVWPHFMEKKGRRSYHSTKVLGQLYDAVETIDFVPSLSKPFDPRILKSKLVPASESFMEFATELKREYDAAMRRIMAQFEIETEFEVWSTFVLSHGSLYKDYKLHEDLGRVVNNLKNGFRQQCFDKAGGRTLEYAAPLVVAMYRVTHAEMTDALQRVHDGPTRDDDDDGEHTDDDDDDGYETSSNDRDTALPLISFPWLFYDFLGKVAMDKVIGSKIEGEGVVSQEQKNAKIYTHAEVEKLLVQMEGSDPHVTQKREDLVSRPELDVKPVKATDEVEELSVKECDSGVDLSSVEDDRDDESPLLLLNTEDEVEELVETEDGVKPSVLNRLIGLLGA